MFHSKEDSLIGYLTGSITGFIKWGDFTSEQKIKLAKQLKWCYEQSNTPMPASVKEDIEKILS